MSMKEASGDGHAAPNLHCQLVELLCRAWDNGRYKNVKCGLDQSQAFLICFQLGSLLGLRQCEGFGVCEADLCGLLL